MCLCRESVVALLLHRDQYPCMFQEPRIWVISTQHWPRALIYAELLERGYEVEGFENCVDASLALESRFSARPHLILLELVDQPPVPICFEAFENAGIPIILLGGSQELTEEVLSRFKSSVILKRPYSIGEVCDFAEKVIR